MKKVHVIHHTHWDFEWYFTTNESFVQLAYHMDEVFRALEDGVIDYYLLDGQMSIVEDYLTHFPEEKERFTALVKAQKLWIGPWYTQTDELIISGESIVRNLSLGMKMAEELGGTMKIGYLPDSFGQGKDMPKIYNGMGIEQAVFWRGLPNDLTEQREFVWGSEDGSEVTALNIKNGYFVGVGLIESDDAKGLMLTIDKDSTLMDVALPVGGDQRYVDFNLKERMQKYNEKLAEDGYQLVESHYPALMAELEKEKGNLPHIQGEFISSSVSKIHRSIYSSRYDHKYMNDKVERRMIYQLEPLMAMAQSLGIPYKKGLLDRIWKLLIRNHAHDSAGGCNSDATNQIINERFREADQLSYSAVDYLTRKIAESRQSLVDNELLFFNTLPRNIRKVVQFEISTTFANFELYQGNKKIDFQLINTEKRYNGSIRRDETAYRPEDYYYVHSVCAEMELPGFSYTVCQITETPSIPDEHKTCLASENLSIENDTYRFEVMDGKCHLTDKRTSKVYEDMLWIENSGDEGDTYDYSPPYQDDIYKLDFSEAKITKESGMLEEVLLVEGHWHVAQDISERYAKKRTESVPYSLRIKLSRHSHRLELSFQINNTAKDHRMRLVVKTDVYGKYSYADSPFGTVKRPVVDPHIHDWQSLGWREEPTTIYPMIHYVNTHNEHSSWTLFSKGIKEYQLIGDNFEQVALTMYRSVGYLGRPDLLRRPGAASGNEFRYVETPDSQLQEVLHVKVAIQLDEQYHPAQLMKGFEEYAISTQYYQIQDLNRFTTTLKYFVSNPLPFKIEQPESLNLHYENIVFSSLRSNENLSGLEIRFYNPSLTDTVKGGVLEWNTPISYNFLKLDGSVISESIQSQKVELGDFLPGEIKTIGICPVKE